LLWLEILWFQEQNPLWYSLKCILIYWKFGSNSNWLTPVKTISLQYLHSWSIMVPSLNFVDAPFSCMSQDSLEFCFEICPSYIGYMQYDEITDENLLLKVMHSYLDDYDEMTNNPMNLVFFWFAIQHVPSICRVIKQPQGHVLLVGVGGSGRQSLARLGAFIQGFGIYQVI
jgi:hypothetical protein